MQHQPGFGRLDWRRVITVMCLVFVSLVGAATPASAQPANSGILPPYSAWYGSTYEQWSAQWWQWALSLPADQNPFFDENNGCANGANGQGGPVWFLTGVFNESGTAVRDCAVPEGKAFFFPLINTECSTLEAEPFYGSNAEELRTCARQFKFKDVFVEIDGVSFPNANSYHVVSPMFEFTLPANDVLGLGPATGQSVSYGYYALVAPLSAGQHVIRFGGTSKDFDFSLDITYHLTVGN